MAAGASTTYRTAFVIGAKLAASFNSTIAQAQVRMRALGATARSVGAAMRVGLAKANAGFAAIGTGISRTIGLVKKLALGLGGLGVIMGGFAATKIFHTISADAAEAAKHEAQAHRRLKSFLMSNNDVRAKGLEYAEKQAHLIQHHNELLEQQQIFDHDILADLSAGVAMSGMPAADITRTTKALTDVLAVSRGVHATTEDAAKLAKIYTIAVKTGMTRGLRGFDVIFTKAEQAKMTAKTTSAYERQRMIMEKIESNIFKGQAKMLQYTPEGRIYLFDRALHDMARRIGREVLPAQAAMADAWRDVLPELEPIVKSFYIAVTHGAQKAAYWVHHSLIPAWKEFVTWWRGPGSEAWARLAKAFKAMAGALGNALVKQFGAVAGKGRTVGEVAVIMLDKLTDFFKWITDNADTILIVIESLTAAFIALKVASVIKGNITIIGLAAAAAGIAKVTSEYQKFQDKQAGRAVSDPEHFTKHWYLMNQSWTEMFAGFKAIWWDLPLDWHNRMMDYFRDFDWTFGFKGQWDDAIQQWKTWVRDIKDQLKYPFGGHSAFRGAGAGSSWGAPGGPVGTSTYMPPPGLPDTRLVALRAKKIAELQDPIVASRFYSNLETEVGSSNAVRAQAYMESVLNRSVARNKTLMETISDTAYYPAVSLRNVAVSAKAIQAYNSVLDQVAAGSNITNYATGNASGTVGFAGGPQTFMSGGERFGQEGPDVGWARGMMRGRTTGVPPLLRRPPEAAPPQASTVNFAPNVVINGNATDAEQRAMDSRLRDMCKDFIAQFKAAQYQERRLSYESGYG